MAGNDKYISREYAPIEAPVSTSNVGSGSSSKMPPQNTPGLGMSGTYDADDMEDTDIQDMEDAELLIGPTMSRMASRMKSPKTPAEEKRNAMEEAFAYFDDEPYTPPATDSFLEGHSFSKGKQSNLPESSQSGLGVRGQQLGASPKLEEQNEHQEVIESSTAHQTPPHTSLKGVFGSDGERKRSLSGGAAALKNFLPKGLSSMNSVGNLFGSANNTIKNNYDGSSSSPREPSRLSTTHSPRTSLAGGFNTINSPQDRHMIISTSTSQRRPRTIRRSTSDDSMLYHTLSRSSSLGDDNLYVNQRQQVNSRSKAIKDSFQDRSSFRLPNMPSMPSMPNLNLPSLPSMPNLPSFTFNLNFLNSSDTPSRARPRSNTDGPSGILPNNIMKRPILSSIPNILPGISSTTASSPEPVYESGKGASDGSRIKELDLAMENLTGDIVIMGGYRGSILRSTKSNRQVWAPVKVGLNIRKVDLAVGLEREDEERMHETIYPAGMLQGIGPVDISKRLFKRLSECENSRNGTLRVWDYGYDWRLSPALLARKLTTFLEKLPSNQPNKDGSRKLNGGALVIAHSLGGLITRHVVNHRPELFSGVVYAGVPQSCINILGPLRNGDAVLLSSRVLTAQVNFTLRTSFVLLPEDGSCFVDIRTRERYPMDFFDINTWIKYRLSPCIDPPLPPRLPPSGLLSGLQLSGSMLSIPLPGGKKTPPTLSSSSSSTDISGKHDSKTTRLADAFREMDMGTDRTLAPQMGNKPMSTTRAHSTSVSMAVTIPRDKAIVYLTRVLAETKKFKKELHFKPELSAANKYPPLALIYGKNIPTCCGAKVDGLEGIPCSDVYDNLAFAAGDGVTLAKEAMLPEGYRVAYGGRIRSDRGHVTLLGDLNAVGKAIQAVQKGRAKGIGTGI